MARYVVLSFQNDSDADEFVNAFNSQGGVFFVGSDTHFKNVREGDHVRGMYQRPTKFCDCAGAGKLEKRTGYSQGKKFGWWVHTGCGKPARAWTNGDHFHAALGKNLLPVSAEAPEWRGSGIPGHVWNEETKQWEHVETGKPWNAKEHFESIYGEGSWR